MTSQPLAATAYDLHPITLDWTDPETGNRWIHLDVPAPGDWEQVQKLPKALAYEGRIYVRTGWNSDKLVAYYRDQMPAAFDIVTALKNTHALIDTPVGRRQISGEFADDVRASVNLALAAIENAP